MKLRTHLILLVLGGVLPSLFYVAVLGSRLALAEQSAREAGLRSTTRALAAAIDERIASVVTSLRMFATTEDIDPRQLDDVYRRAARAVQSQTGWRSISLARPSGEVLLHTERPLGAALPSLADEPYFRRVVDERMAAVSGYRVVDLPGAAVVTVGVPVIRDDEVAYVLSGSVDVGELSRLLTHHVPAGGTAAILDERGVILGRTRAAEAFVGTVATPAMLERLRETREAAFEEDTKEGTPAFGWFTSSRLSGWTIVLGVPTETFEAPVRRTVVYVVGGGAGLVLVGVLLVFLRGRRISKPMRALAAAAAAVGQRRPFVPVDSTVHELADVALALEHAARERDQSEQILRDANATLDEERRTVETLHQVGSALAAELDLERLLQRLTDEATSLTGAQFGAYFHTGRRDDGEVWELFTLSGAPKHAFERFGRPRNTAIFRVTFAGGPAVRLDDVTQDPRYGQSPPHYGLPKGHLPVRSYLALPVVLRSGEVAGGLFFGHERVGVFTERHEHLLKAIAAQAAVAIENATLYRKAQEAVQLRDSFLSVASHELKTPLTPLQLHLGLLRDRLRREDGSLTPDVLQRSVERMLSQVERLGRLIDELLDVSRIAAGRMELFSEDDVDLSAVVGEIAGHFESERARTGSSLTLSTSGPVIGTWDRSRLEQVVTNLLANALKYGDGKPIELSVEGDDERAILVVRDHGIGIPPEHQARVFERFERAVSSRNYGGLGLGLWIVRRILGAMGGSISVESAPGEGSRFTVKLPRRPPPSSQGSA